MTDRNDKVLIEITAQDMYDTLNHIKDTLTEMQTENALGHGNIVAHQKITNGKVKMNRKLIYTLGAILFSSLSLLITVLVQLKTATAVAGN